MANNYAQCDRIVEYIKKHGSISVGIAHTVLHIGNFGARMTNLRQRGYKFSSLWRETDTPYGKARYKEHFLEKEPE